MSDVYRDDSSRDEGLGLDDLAGVSGGYGKRSGVTAVFRCPKCKSKDVDGLYGLPARGAIYGTDEQYRSFVPTFVSSRTLKCRLCGHKAPGSSFILQWV